MRHAGTQDHHVALFNKGARVPLELARHLALFSPLPKILGQSIFAALSEIFALPPRWAASRARAMPVLWPPKIVTVLFLRSINGFFNVIRVMMTRMMEMIQKRMMICDSCQPDNCK